MILAIALVAVAIGGGVALLLSTKTTTTSAPAGSTVVTQNGNLVLVPADRGSVTFVAAKWNTPKTNAPPITQTNR